MATILIRHDRESGTLIFGTARKDGTAQVIGGFRAFRRSRALPDGAYWHIPHSRDNIAQEGAINACAEALRAAGHTVTVEIDNVTPATTSVAEREADRYRRADARAERFDGYAGNATARGSALVARARAESDRIPFGQPMMPDHHSYASDRNRRERTARTRKRGFDELDRGEHWEDRADAAGRYQVRREDIPRTIRRIERLEEARRGLERDLDGVDREAAPETLARLDRLIEEIEYWQEQVAAAEEVGVKVWRPSDFKEGDLVEFGHGWYEVTRVGDKSLSVPGMQAVVKPWTFERMRARNPRNPRMDTVKYDRVLRQMDAAEARETFPDSFIRPDDAPPLPPAKKRGKVKLEHSPGAMWEGWWFDHGGERYYVRWMHPEGWFAATSTAAPFDEPGSLTVVRSTGLSSSVPVETIPVTGPIRYVEEVHNQVRAWVERFATSRKE
jgi:hypothetical protein